MFKVNNKDIRIRKVNDKVKNKDTLDVVLASFTSCYSASIVEFDQLIAG